MYKYLLIAVDGSGESGKAMAAALAKALTTKATVVTATEPWIEAAYATLPTPPSMISAYEKSTAGNAASILNNAKQNAEGAGVHCEVHHASDQHAPDAIIKLAKEKKCELIVIGSHGRGSSVGSSLAALPSSAHFQPSAGTRLPLDFGGCP
jgi:nucleotide-binding universal stress UspA family protein